MKDEFPTGHDISSWPKMRTHFSDVFKSKTQGEWVKIFESKDACFAPVLSLDEATKDPHNIARGAFMRGNIDGNELSEPKPAPKLVRTPGREDMREQPKLGEHTVNVLREEGFQTSEIDDFLKDGVIKQYVPSSSL